MKNKLKIVKIYSSGGITDIHDYLMSDGSVFTMRKNEADFYGRVKKKLVHVL